MSGRILAFVLLTVVSVSAQCLSGSAGVREYSADNGRKIKVTALGNLIGAEMPMGFEHFQGRSGPREGYVLAYTNPLRSGTGVVVTHDVCDHRSSVTGPPDLLPVSFTGPPDGTRFRVGESITATAVVETRDHVLRLTHVITWITGTGTVAIQSLIENLLSVEVPLRGFKRVAHLQVDTAGTWGTGEASHNNWTRAGAAVLNWGRCGPLGYCPPPPERIIGVLLATHMVKMSGSPAATRVTIRAATDDAELTSAYPVAAGDITARSSVGDNQAALCWVIGTSLSPGARAEYTVRYEEQ